MNEANADQSWKVSSDVLRCRKPGHGTGRVIASKTAQRSYVEAMHEECGDESPSNGQRVAVRSDMLEVNS